MNTASTTALDPGTFKGYRRLLGLSCSQLAELLGVSSTERIREWERGARTIPHPIALFMILLANVPEAAQWALSGIETKSTPQD